jgi:hypothetical protein
MKRLPFFVIVTLFVTMTAVAQQGSVAVLEYAPDMDELRVLDRDGFDVDIFIGIGLSPGDRIIAGDTSAELRLEPNGSILRIAPGTSFTLEAIQGHNGASETRGVVRSGAARFVAARDAVRENTYTMRTPSVVAGVRGTDFGLSALQDPGGQGLVEEVFVFTGEVIVASEERGEEVFLSAGQGIAAADEPFLPQAWSQERIQRFQGPLQFEQLDPDTVPGRVPDEVAEEPEPEDDPDEVVVDDVEPTDRELEREPGIGDDLFARLAGITGMEVGSVTINRQTYGQLVFQPRITFGKFDLALYLPITYTSNIFDPDDWYRPAGNNEWSFGTDQDWNKDTLGALQDLGTDIALKFRYLQYGDQDDPFFLKLGNLGTFTVGQGLLMRNYANDSEFPAIRRAGFNIGIDRTAWGFEALVNDLFEPSIYGGRLFFRPAAPVVPAAVGFSAITDLSPSRAIAKDSFDPSTGMGSVMAATREGDPIFVNVAADLEVPFIRRNIFSLIGYAEAGTFIPYVQEDTVLLDTAISSGAKTNALVDFDSGDMRNYGVIGGIRGVLAIFDYRLEYQYFDGTFRPGFYGPTYDRFRGTYAAETMLYLADPDDPQYDDDRMAIAGEAGATLFDALHIGVGYLWPWEISPSGSWKAAEEDEFLVRFSLREGVIPLGLGAGLEYRRRFFAPSIAGWGGYSSGDLFDANTTLDGYLSYPLTDFISIVARVSTAAQRDSEGELVYDSDGRPRMAPTVVIQTEIGL